jgi:hypothetical protein
LNALTLLKNLQTYHSNNNLPSPDKLKEDIKDLEHYLSNISPILEQTNKEVKDQLELNKPKIQKLSNLDNPTTEDITTVISLKALDQTLIDSLEEKHKALEDGYAYISGLVMNLSDLNLDKIDTPK